MTGKQHLIYQCGFAMIDMGNNRYVPDVLHIIPIFRRKGTKVSRNTGTKDKIFPTNLWFISI
jgi:hypothetical protein